MLPKKRAWWEEAASRATPFFIGVALAIGAFVFLGWDLAHHYVSYSPGRPPSSWGKLWPVPIWLAALAPAGIHRLRRLQSQSWPCAATTIEGDSIAFRRGRHSSYCLVTVAYAYSVNGERYGGVDTGRFRNELEAETALKNMRCSLPARYNPTDPFESTL
jgi:Protein of unknown function (DUF3592)